MTTTGTAAADFQVLADKLDITNGLLFLLLAWGGVICVCLILKSAFKRYF